MNHNERCPRCDSPEPHLHPAVQVEGEVQVCTHDYHRQETPQITAQRISEVNALLKKIDNAEEHEET